MTSPSVAERGVVRIPIPRLRAHQQPVADHPARFKVVRAGRRWGKDRLAFTCSIAGHGPDRQYRGLVQGLDVVWLAPDYPQAAIIWMEEIRPRFKGVPGVQINETEHWVLLPNGGRLFVRSNESIEGIRGLGKRLAGIVVNEAAHFDLEYAWRSVIRPTLSDNRGWALIMSTTNGGLDGNARKVVPSFFNRLCAQVIARRRGPDWAHFYGTAHDNPTLDPAEIKDLIAEYPAESASLKQEVYAELVVGGGGMAFPELNERVHFIRPERFRIMPHWTHFGAFDWGFSHPWVFIWFVVNEDGDVFVVDTVRGRKHQPAQIAERVLDLVPVDRLDYVSAGDDVGADKTYIADKVPTYQERLAEHGLLVTPTKVHRVSAYDNLRDFLRWQEAGPEGQDWTPQLRFLDTPRNRWLFDQLGRMVTDPARPEDVLKVDADPNTGEGGDDGYDALKLALASRAPTSAVPASPWGEEYAGAFDADVLEHESREKRRVKRQMPRSSVIPDAVV